MLVVLNAKITDCEINEAEKQLKAFGFSVQRSNGQNRFILRISGNLCFETTEAVKTLPYVEKIIFPSYPFELVSRDYQQEKTVFKVGEVEIGAKKVVIMAGPCAVEGRETYLRAAEAVKKAGAHILRGGAYKPRSSPYAFQGLEEEGLKIMAEARSMTGLPIITEVLDQYSVEIVADYAEYSSGGYNMENTDCFKNLERQEKPVLLKRNVSDYRRWLMAAEYLNQREQQGYSLRKE